VNLELRGRGVRRVSGVAVTPVGNACGIPKAKSRFTPLPCQPPASQTRGDTRAQDEGVGPIIPRDSPSIQTATGIPETFLCECRYGGGNLVG